MARSCACDRWFSRAASDIGFHALPHIVQLLWFRLAAAALGAEEKGHIRFPCSVAMAVTGMLNRSGTEAASDLAALVDLGWVQLDADGRGLWMRGAKAGAARAEAARINGQRGGRRRKDDTPETYLARRQGHLPLPIAGGRLETQETETEPSAESSRAAAKPIAIEEKQAAAAREKTDFVALGAELADILGLDPARGGHSYGLVKGWLDAGIPADLIRDVARQRAEKARASGMQIRGFLYLRDAVPEAHARAQARTASTDRISDWDRYEAEVMRQWEANGRHGTPMSIDDWRATQRAVA